MRYDVILDSSGGEREAFVAWLSTHSERITAISEVGGCRCCVDLLSLEVEAGTPAPPHGNEVEQCSEPLSHDAASLELTLAEVFKAYRNFHD